MITPTPSTVEMRTSESLLMMVTQVKSEELMDRFRLFDDENKSGLCRCFCADSWYFLVRVMSHRWYGKFI